MKRLNSQQADFQQTLSNLLTFEEDTNAQVLENVGQILSAVRSNGDAALLEYTRRFDRIAPDHASALEISKQRMQEALAALPADQQEALSASAERIRIYHERQKQSSWEYTDAEGTVLGQQITALDSAGLYVPGGKAAYPSSVLMNAIPAKVAGVETIIMVVPTPDGELNPLVLAAAAVAGVDRVLTIGGAQAVAALAYGTETIPKVDKIVGPGNIYVATAKKLVFGTVGIDMIAGPSEICIVADGKTPADWIAMDLFSQAEHDELAQAILISSDEEYLNEVDEAIKGLLPAMERKDIIAASLRDRGALIKVSDLQEATDVINLIAPEHLELSVEKTACVAAADSSRRGDIYGPLCCRGPG